MSTALDTCDDIIQALAEVGLLNPPGLERARLFRRKFPDKGPRDLTAFLASQGLLTPFQADITLRGAARQLVMPPFVITEILGAGSMGQTAKARSREDDAWYAIKTVPRKNILNLQTVTDQVAKLKEIRHPRVSAMVHVGVFEDRVFLVWPFLDSGEKLETIVHRQGRLMPRAAVQVAQQIASGLKEYHAHGLFHGLLKPNDILIGRDRRVRILDFGVGFLLTCERGKSLLDTTTNSKAISRGVDCASPESINDPLDRTVFGDQYSLGCILYFCLVGQFPFPDSNPVKKMLGHQFEEPVPMRDLVPEMPVKLANIVGRMLAKKPEDRYPNMESVIGEFQRIIPELAEAAPPRPAVAVAASPKPLPAIVAAPPRPTSPPKPSINPRPRIVTSNKAVTPSRLPARSMKPRSRKVFLATMIGITAGLLGGLLTWWLMRQG